MMNSAPPRHRRRPAFRRALASVFLFSFGILATAPGAFSQSARIPQPEKGQSPLTTFALLRHGQERCTGISQRLNTYWSRVSGTAREQEATLDRYLLTRATEDLAAAREALDFARQLLPKVQIEAKSSTGAVFEQLYKAQTTFCDLVNQPKAPRKDFFEKLDRAQADIERIEAQLSTRLELPKDKKSLYQQFEPYEDLIDHAAGVAQEQMLQDTRVTPEPVALPTELELMQAWHQRYQAAATPTKTALRAFLVGRQQNDNKAIRQACEDMVRECLALLGKNEVFETPEPTLSKFLRLAYSSIRTMGLNCRSGEWHKTDEAYERMQRHLATATEALKPYSLRP